MSIQEPSSQPSPSGAKDFSDTWLIVPCYNEGTVIKDVLSHARATFPNIVAVNDGSADDSARQIHLGGAHLVNHPVNLGQGAAIQTGIEYARKQPGAQYFCTFDADGQHQVKDVVMLSPTTRKLGLSDAHNGLRVFNAKVAREMNIRMNGMSHASEIVSMIADRGWRVAEEPVDILYTEYSMSKGQSLINGINILADGLLAKRI